MTTRIKALLTTLVALAIVAVLFAIAEGAIRWRQSTRYGLPPRLTSSTRFTKRPVCESETGTPHSHNHDQLEGVQRPGDCRQGTE
jgi:hypothetical protein